MPKAGLDIEVRKRKGSEMISPKVIDTIRIAAVQAWNSLQKWIDTPDATGNSPKDKMIEFIRSKAEAAAQAISPEEIKVALSYSEKSYLELNFKDLLALVKQSYTLKPGMRICVLMTKGDISVFDIMACNEKNEIAFSTTCPWSHLIVANPDIGLIQMFGDKSMLVLK